MFYVYPVIHPFLATSNFPTPHVFILNPFILLTHCLLDTANPTISAMMFDVLLCSDICQISP